MANPTKFSFEVEHFYPNFDQQKFWDFFVDHEWYSQSDLMQGEIIVDKPGEDHPQGLGAVRRIVIGNINLTEDVVGFDAPRYFSYAVHHGGMPVNDYRGEFFLEPKDGGILWKYRGNFNPKYFGTGLFFKYFLRSRIKSMFPVWEKGYNAYHNDNV